MRKCDSPTIDNKDRKLKYLGLKTDVGANGHFLGGKISLFGYIIPLSLKEWWLSYS